MPLAARRARQRWRALAEALAAGGLAVPRDAARLLPWPAPGPPPASVLFIHRPGAVEPAALRALAAHGGRAVLALRRWRNEPRDTEALAEGVAALDEAARLLEALAPGGGEPAARDLAWAVGRATRFGPEDGARVFQRAFEALLSRHLADLGQAPRKGQEAAAASGPDGPAALPR